MPPRRPQLVPPRTSAARPPVHPPLHPFDQSHGTDTGGLIPAAELLTGHESDQHVTAYYGIAPSILRSIIDLWLQRTAPPFPVEDYTFVDIGAGKGRAILVAAECPFREVIGIELNPTLAAIARRNVEIVSKPGAVSEGEPELLSPISVIQADVLACDLPAGPTLAFLFHPFEAPLLTKLLRHIELQLAARPGQLDLLYVNAEHAAVIDATPGFTALWRGAVPMSTQDHLADLREIAGQEEYGSTGDENCVIYRYTGRSAPAAR